MLFGRQLYPVQVVPPSVVLLNSDPKPPQVHPILESQKWTEAPPKLSSWVNHSIPPFVVLRITEFPTTQPVLLSIK